MSDKEQTREQQLARLVMTLTQVLEQELKTALERLQALKVKPEQDLKGALQRAMARESAWTPDQHGSVQQWTLRRIRQIELALALEQIRERESQDD